MVLRSLVSALVLAGLVGCGQSSKPALSEKAPVDSEKIAPRTEVVFSYFNDMPFGRFAVEISNPSVDLTRVGVKATWKMLDADGVIVGTYNAYAQPPIPPKGSVYYVGGAGSANLTGEPVRVSVQITDKGRLVKKAPALSIKVVDATFTKSGSALFPSTSEYDASVTLEALGDVSRESLHVPVVLKDDRGEVVGVEWADLTSVPDSLAKGEKVKVTANVTVPIGTPTKVEASAADNG